jgi:hypothetical protein
MNLHFNELVKYVNSEAFKPVLELLSEGLSLSLTVLIIPFGKKIIKETYEKYRVKKDLKQRERVKKIRDLFKEEIEKYGFDRVVFLEIHNGTKTVNGLSLKKFSCTIEVKKTLEIPSIKAEMQDIKLLEYDQYIEKFIDNGLEYSENIFDYPDEHIKASMDLKGIKSFFVYFVTNRFGLPCGWVRFEMIKERTYTSKELEEIKAGIKLLSYKIAYLKDH